MAGLTGQGGVGRGQAGQGGMEAMRQGHDHFFLTPIRRIQNLDIPRAGRQGTAARTVGQNAARPLRQGVDLLFSKLPDMPCMKTCRIQNPDTPSGGFGRRAGGGRAAGGRAATAKLCVQHPLNYFVSGHDRQLSWKTLRGHKRIKSYVNRLGEHDGRLTSG